MERYKLQERIKIIKIHYKDGENLAETVCKTRTFLGRREVPCRTAVEKLVEKFELLGQVSDVKNETRARRSRTAENIAAAAESFQENPDLSIPRRSSEFGIPQTSLHLILHKDLGLNAYKVQLTHEPKLADHQQRRVFADWVVVMHENDPEFHRKIILSEETHFHLDGSITSTCYFLVRFMSDGVIGPYLFENEVGATVTVNGLRYREITFDFWWPKLDSIDLDNVYFQQDGAMCHISNETIDVLRKKFPGRVMLSLEEVITIGHWDLVI